jgi:ParB/RepB/Spo0J family partition protein
MTTLTILEAPTPPESLAPIIVDELLLEDGSTFGKFALCHIRISTTNRKRFNPEKLQQLADSIRAKGVAQPILLRPVEPTADAPQRYEIIAGERRFRASIAAGLTHIPAISRAMSDHDAIELQILENLQREDPHPLEEAEGYERLMLTHGYNADQLAERLKKSRSYIYGRLKLCALALDVREPFLNDEISASTALLIARIPVPKLQAQALAEILKPNSWSTDPMSVRAAAQHVQDRYTLTLAKAPFDIKDARLLAAAGACGTCPKRTGNQPVLYPDVDANICTDPECFAEKRAANDAKVIVQANKAKIPVLRGAEAKAVLADAYSIMGDSGLWRLDRVAPDQQHRKIDNALTAEQMPTPIAVLELDNGLVSKQYDKATLQAAAEKAGLCLTREAWDALLAEKEATPQAQARKEEQKKQAAEYAERTRRAEKLTAERLTLYRKVRTHAGSGLSLASLRELAKHLVKEFNLPRNLLGTEYPFEDGSDAGAAAYIDQASQGEVQMIILDLLLGDCIEANHWNMAAADDANEEGFAVVRAIARHEGITLDDAGPTISIEPHADTFGIDVAVLQDADTLRAFITDNPAKLNDVTPLVIQKAPHLVKSLDVIGHETGYMWRDNEWHAPEPAKLAPAAAWPFPTDTAEGAAEVARKTLTLKPRAASSDDGDAIRTKKPSRTTTLTGTLAYTAPESDNATE